MFDNFQQIEAFFESRKRFGIKPGLDRINRLLALLDNPQNKLKAIHIAGTNGKGSTINYIKDALIPSGYRVGVFTSPSFAGLTGHILLDDKPISIKEFIGIFNAIYPMINELDSNGNHPTEFEIITAMMFVYFTNNADIALIETGMGGREDTTNCFIPILSIITNVAMDHMTFLGNTPKSIARHKAGIIKRRVPVIVGWMDLDAMAVMHEEANRNHAPVYQLSHDFTFENLKQTEDYQYFRWSANNIDKQIEVKIKMKGSHQRTNTSIALMALCILEQHGYNLNWDRVLAGISQSQMPGRFETVHQNPTVVIDGAHNVAGVESFIKTVKELYPNKDKHLIFAGFKDKELGKMLEKLSGIFQTVMITTFNHPRAADANDLYHSVSIKNKRLNENWHEALTQIIQQANDNQSIFVTGSLHFIASVRKYFVNS